MTVSRIWCWTGIAAVLLTAGCAGESPVARDAPVPTAPAMTGASSGPSDDVVQVLFETTKGNFVVEVHPEWAPLGAERFLDLVRGGFYNGCKFFRVLPEFVVQFGINGNPEIQAKWRDANINDEPVKQSNVKGTMTLAKGGPNSRTSQIFINYGDNQNLDAMGFPAFAKVVSGMDVVEQITAEYGESPDQQRIQYEGNAYLEQEFPNLDAVINATIVDGQEKGPAVDDEPKQEQEPKADR